MSMLFKKVSVTLVLALVVSVSASLSAFASSEIRVEMNDSKGQFITVSNVVEEKALDFEGASHPVYIVNAPAVVKFDGGSFRSQYIGYSTEFEIIDGNIATKTDMVEFDVNKYVILGKDGTYDSRPKPDIKNGIIPGGASGNFATLNKEGYYLVSGVPYDDKKSSSKGTSILVQVTGRTTVEAKTVTITATPTASKVLVNGKEISFEAYNIDGNNYFKLRDVAQAVNGTEKNFEVTWDGAKNAINLKTKKGYTSDGTELVAAANLVTKDAVFNKSDIFIDGGVFGITAYNIEGNNYFKLRDIGKVINFGVIWDAVSNSISIDTKEAYKE